MKKIIVTLGLLLLCFGFSNNAYAYSTEGSMYYNEGIDAYYKGDYDKALKSFQAAVQKDSDYVDAYYNLGTLYQILKNYNKAIDCFNKVNQLEPANSEIILKLAELYYLSGNQQRALVTVNQINENDVLYNNAKSLKNSIIAAQRNYASKTSLGTTNQAVAANKNVIATFKGPTGLAVDSIGNLYVASFTENCIYKITPNNQAYLFSKAPEIGGPIGLAVDEADNLYVANYSRNNILKINKAGEVFVFMDNIVNPYYLIINGNYMFITEQGSNKAIKYKLY